MVRNMQQFIFYLILMTECLSRSHANVQQYRTRVIKDPQYSVVGTPTEQSVSKRSRIECSVACSQDKRCLSFFYDKSQKECRMSTGPVLNTDTTTLGKNIRCPADLGYRLLIYPDMTLCLKYNSNPLDHTFAAKACEEDGGHLALIDSSTMHSYIPSLINDFNMSPEFTYFDGYDPNHNNIYYTWKNELLPWVQWQGNNPDNRDQEDCIQIHLGDNEYFLRDCECFLDNPFVCQIEIH